MPSYTNQEKTNLHPRNIEMVPSPPLLGLILNRTTQAHIRLTLAVMLEQAGGFSHICSNLAKQPRRL